MKKGFTIVELIICIVLLGLIGTSATIISLKTSHKKEEKLVNEINDKILEASKLYLYVEKDDLGNTYQEGIFAGGRGVQISVKNLIDSGYIEEEYVKTLEQNPEDMYIIASLSTSNAMKDNCETGTLQFERSWITTSTEPIYLCAYDRNLKADNSLYNTIKSNRTCLAYNNSKKGSCNIDENNYFYTGEINNNYVKFQNTNTLFRIVKTESKTDNSGYYIKLTPKDRISVNSTSSAIPNSFRVYANDKVSYIIDKYGNYRFDFNANINSDGSINVSGAYVKSCDYKAYSLEFEGWDYSSTINTASSSCGNIPNPYYKIVYEPLKKWYDSLSYNIQKFAIEYKYCVKEDDCDNYSITSKFAALSNQDYNNISRIEWTDNGYLDEAYIWDQQISLDGEGIKEINEIVFSKLASGFKFLSKGGAIGGYAKNNIHLRPTIMIDGNIKVISGVGTYEDPYILKT